MEVKTSPDSSASKRQNTARFSNAPNSAGNYNQRRTPWAQYLHDTGEYRAVGDGTLWTNLGALCVEAVLLEPALDVFRGERDCFRRHELHKHLKEPLNRSSNSSMSARKHSSSSRSLVHTIITNILRYLSSFMTLRPVACQLGGLPWKRTQASHVNELEQLNWC